MHVALYWIFFTGSRHAKASKLHALEHSHVGVTRIPARVDAIHFKDGTKAFLVPRLNCKN